MIKWRIVWDYGFKISVNYIDRRLGSSFGYEFVINLLFNFREEIWILKCMDFGN